MFVNVGPNLAKNIPGVNNAASVYDYMGQQYLNSMFINPVNEAEVIRISQDCYVFSLIFHGEFFLESSDIPETKNQCCHLNGNLFGPPSWIAKWTPSNSFFDNILHAKQYRKSISVAMTTFLAVGKRMD